MTWLLPVGLLIAAGFVLWFRFQRMRPKYLALCEYWVYLPGVKLPSQDSMMDRMINGNPHNRRGVAWIGAKEGILFSDVRLRLTLATREKNPNMFRPDLFDSAANPSAEVLEGLANSKAIARVRYASDEPLQDRRHLTFLPHLVDAVSDLGAATIIYDCVSEQFILSRELSAALDSDPQSLDKHIQVVWNVELEDYFAETKGLRKIGCSELRSDFSTGDQRQLMMTLIEEAAQWVWKESAVPESLEVEKFGGQFLLSFRHDKKADVHRVSILRKMQ